MDITGTVAIVTGASRGLGAHIARAVGEAGASVALAARDANALEAVREVVATTGVATSVIPTDVTDAAARSRLVAETVARLGPPDILVNNAGVETAGPFERRSEADLRSVVEVNLVAALLLTREVLPGMLERGRGHVVNVASMAGKFGVPFQVAYSASKFGLVGATAALRAEYHDRPIGFSAVCPGFVTEDGMYARFEEQGARAPRIAGTTTPGKVARAVVRAIQRDQAEVVVNDLPVRPLTMLAEAAPALYAPIAKLSGLTEMARTMARLDEPEDEA